jgi:cytochrome c
MNLAKIQLGVGCLFAVSIVLSTIHPWGNPRTGARSDAPLLEGSSVPDNVRGLLAAKCGDCHSERTHYPLYAHIAPVSWMMERDIHSARSQMNLSEWQFTNSESRISVLTRMASVVRTGQMPPRMYVMLHRGARLSPEEEQQIYEWAKAERKRIRQEVPQRSDQSFIESGKEKR